MANLQVRKKNIFNWTHLRHLESMEWIKRKDYALQSIKQLKWNEQKGCIKIYFKNGEWYHYYPSYTWDRGGI